MIAILIDLHVNCDSKQVFEGLMIQGRSQELSRGAYIFCSFHDHFFCSPMIILNKVQLYCEIALLPVGA